MKNGSWEVGDVFINSGNTIWHLTTNNPNIYNVYGLNLVIIAKQRESHVIVELDEIYLGKASKLFKLLTNSQKIWGA